MSLAIPPVPEAEGEFLQVGYFCQAGLGIFLLPLLYETTMIERNSVLTVPPAKHRP